MLERDSNGQITFGRLEYFIQALIVTNLLVVGVETIPDLPRTLVWIFNVFEICSVIIFTVEYLVRILGGRPRLSYAWSFMGVVDLLAIIPFYLSLGLDLRSFRAFRLLRLVRLLKLARYSRAMRRYHRAFMIAKEEIILFGITALIVLYLAAVGIYFFEHEAQPKVFSSVFHSLWWAVATLTTVGYGDVYPVTIGGKIFTFLVLSVGLGIVAVPTGLLASALASAREIEQEDPL
ncbi:ion transporter [Dethiosulfatarculus sandiegensis]|uniref:Voltage-gated potassium channel n=1 Tax=Dethiosulfatarculus sandiegensis TaxID=1429043 RepID=A0A0D2GBY2_9BACT|nr:ion transporter [Dethiosulfatarculus sandiegensis]KIX12402.1 voltage-gated potassium channel [Dethiosulfatarculus sandiegensis]